MELALTMPLLVICLAGLVWLGQMMVTQLRLEHAVREGARAAAVEPADASNRAATAVQGVIPEAETVVAVTETMVRVEVSVETPGVPLVGIGARQLTADAVMRREDIVG